jgi:hypothetical protein
MYDGISSDESAWNATFDHSVTVGLRALVFVRSDQPILRRFLSNSGLTYADIDRGPLVPRHLATLLDFVIADEPVLQRFARRAGLSPEAAYEARRILGRRAPSNADV